MLLQEAFGTDLLGFGHGLSNDAGGTRVICNWDEGPG